MTDVMHQDGCLDGLCLAVEDEDAFLCECHHSLAHQVISTQRVLETGMLRSGIDHRGQTHLLDVAQTLHQRVVDNVHQDSSRNLDETEDGVVDDLSFAHLHPDFGELGRHGCLQRTGTVGCGIGEVFPMAGIDDAAGGVHK